VVYSNGATYSLFTAYASEVSCDLGECKALTTRRGVATPSFMFMTKIALAVGSSAASLRRGMPLLGATIVRFCARDVGGTNHCDHQVRRR